MPNRSIALLLFAFSSTWSLSAEEQEDLFAGSELRDFYFDSAEKAKPEDIYTITETGTLEVRGKDKTDSYLQTLDDYQDFEISFEWRWVGKPGKSGIMIHSTTSRHQYIWPESIEVDLDEKKAGEIVMYGVDLEVEDEDQEPTRSKDRNRRFKLKTKLDPRDRNKGKEKPADQWNAMRIVAFEDTLRVYLNGGLVNKAVKLSEQGGYITFQSEGADIDFRNVWIRDIDDEPEDK